MNVRDRVEPDVSLALEYGGSTPPGLLGSFSAARTNGSTSGHSLLEIITKGDHWQVLSLFFSCLVLGHNWKCSGITPTYEKLYVVLEIKSRVKVWNVRAFLSIISVAPSSFICLFEGHMW